MLLRSPSYRLAVEDLDFLDGGEARGARLQLDYLKPEMLLRQHGIDATIVVFGSTRIAMNLEVGVWLRAPKLSSGTSGLVSG